MRYLLFLFFCGYTLFAQTPDPLLASNVEDQIKWVDSTYVSLSLEEKIGQLFMVMAFSEQGKEHLEKIANNIEEDKIGGVVFSLGGPLGQTNWLNQFQDKAKTPLLIGMDAEWGVAMRLDSVQAFPWNMTLGAIQDNDIIEEIGFRIGEQAKRLGVHINFAPSVDINTNPSNPIIGNRSFGEDKNNVSEKGIVFIKGMHRAGVLSSAKHFPGHGDTETDSHLGLPSINFSKKRIHEIELYPFKKIIQEGVSSVMVAHLDIKALDPGIPSSLSPKIVKELLLDSLQYKGLVITDALNMKGASDISPKYGIDVAAFLAGNDILLIPNDVKSAIKQMKRALNDRVFSEERLAYSVKKILKAKYFVGLNKSQATSSINLIEDLNSTKDDYLIQKAMESAVTVVQNKNNILPLDVNKTYGYIKIGDDDGLQFESTLSSKIKLHKVDTSMSINQIIEALNPHKSIIIGFHRSNENPWKASGFSKKERQLLAALSKNHKLILNVFVKPYALNKLSNLNEIEGIVVSYQNSTLAQKASAKVFLGEHKATGKLPVSIYPNFPAGTGITLEGPTKLRTGSPLEVGLNPKTLEEIDKLAKVAMDSLMTPGMQILVARYGKVVFNKSYGFHTYEKKIPVTNNDIYDLASLTKILTTLPLVIQEVDQKKLSLDATLGSLKEEWKNSNKANIKIKDMLSHYARLVPWIPFYKETLKEGSTKLNKKFYRKRKSNRYPIPVADNFYGKKKVIEEISNQIISSELRDTLEYKYSDLPYFLMKDLLEERYKQPLSELAHNSLYKSMGLKKTTFNPKTNLPNLRVIPSEIDTYFRNQELKGEVHDMGAAMLGGIGGHAGLFSNATEVGAIMQMFLQKGLYDENQFFSSTTFDQFNQCLYCEEGNRRGVGFDKPQIEGRGSTCGCVPKASFGHSGFTGTYAWADPENELIYVFLSNRTYPSMENNLLLKHDIRTRIQRYIYDAIIN